MAMLNPGDRLGSVFAGTPTLITARVGYNQDGVLGWVPNRPRPHNNNNFWYTPGGANNGVTAQHYLQNTNGGATRTAIALGGSRQQAGRLDCTAAAAARISLTLGNASADIRLSASSGRFVHEFVFTIPDLPDATNDFEIAGGLVDAITDASQADGAYLYFDRNDTEFQLVTASNSTRTTTDTGVTAVAGTAYRARVEVDNNTEVRLYLATLGTVVLPLVATNTTNIPSGAGRETGAGFVMVGIAGTGAGTKLVDLAYQYTTREKLVSFSGMRVHNESDLNSGDGVNSTVPTPAACLQMGLRGDVVTPRWGEFLPSDAIPLLAYHQTISTHSPLFIADVSGTSASVTLVARDEFFGVSNCTTGTTAAGRAAMTLGMSVPAIVFDGDSGRMVYEAVFQPSVLSSGGNQGATRWGFIDSITGVPADGAWLELDSVVDTEFQFVTSGGSVETRTDTAVTASASTWYWVVIYVLNDQEAVLRIAALADGIEDNTFTHNTNIPTGTSEATGAGVAIVKASGTTAIRTEVESQVIYQRRAA